MFATLPDDRPSTDDELYHLAIRDHLECQPTETIERYARWKT